MNGEASASGETVTRSGLKTGVSPCLSKGWLILQHGKLVAEDSILTHTQRCPQHKSDDDEHAAVPL